MFNVEVFIGKDNHDLQQLSFDRNVFVLKHEEADGITRTKTSGPLLNVFISSSFSYIVI
jgi:hypothetical protein